jgi:glucokinase
MTLAEAVCGVAKEFDPVFGVTLGTGIGGGLVIDGRIYRGVGSAGEIGHMSVDSHGSACKCGQRGCLELYAAASRLTAHYRELTGSTISPSVVLERWSDGDKNANEAVITLAHWIGIGVGNVLNLLHPACLVIGGGLMEVGERFFETIRQSIREHCLPAIVRSVLIQRAHFGNQAGVVGAALFAMGNCGAPTG